MTNENQPIRLEDYQKKYSIFTQALIHVLGVLTHAAGRLKRKEIINHTGNDALEKLVQELLQGRPLIIVIMPHTHSFDPVMVEESELVQILKKLGSKHSWVTAAKLYYNLPGVAEGSKIFELFYAGYSSRFPVFPIVQTYLIKELQEKFEELKALPEDKQDKNAISEIQESLNKLRMIKRRLDYQFIKKLKIFFNDKQNMINNVLLIAPEGTRNGLGGLLRAESGAGLLVKNHEGSVLTLVYHRHRRNPYLLFCKVGLEVLPPINYDTLQKLTDCLEWTEEALSTHMAIQEDSEFTGSDSIMLLGALHLDPMKDQLVANVDPRGVYQPKNVRVKDEEEVKKLIELHPELKPLSELLNKNAQKPDNAN